MQVQKNQEYMTAVADTINTNKSLRNVTFIRVAGKTVAKMSFTKGISIQVYAEDNKLLFNSFLW